MIILFLWLAFFDRRAVVTDEEENDLYANARDTAHSSGARPHFCNWRNEILPPNEVLHDTQPTRQGHNKRRHEDDEMRRRVFGLRQLAELRREALRRYWNRLSSALYRRSTVDWGGSEVERRRLRGRRRRRSENSHEEHSSPILCIA